MTTIRGKVEPLELGSTPDVTYSMHSQTVLIKTGGYHKGVEFKVWGRLSPECTRNFILELRKALRKLSDETRQRLEQAVREAEKPL